MSYTKSDLRYLLLIGIRKEYGGALTDRETHKMADDMLDQVLVDQLQELINKTLERQSEAFSQHITEFLREAENS